MLAAELATGIDSPVIADVLAFDQPERLPPEPLAWIGVSAAIRWKERKAGAEL